MDISALSRVVPGGLEKTNPARLSKIRQEAKDFASETGSSLGVPPLSKQQKGEVAKGGATYFSSTISPTDFIPNPDKKETDQTPDYYRNGRQRVETTVVDNQTVKKTFWEPIPELIADRESPLLANIRLIDTSKQKTAEDKKTSGKRLIPEFSKFFLESVAESHQEKMQTVETFNDWYVFFYGERPPVYNFSGYLLNTASYNWYNEFMYYYENYWRGTQAVKMGGKIFLTYNFQQVQGYLLSVSTNLNAISDKAAPFVISMIVTKRMIFSGRPDDNLLLDSLLPRSETGLINTFANSSSIKLTREYLGGKAPASDNKGISDANRPQSKKVIDKSAKSTVVQSTKSMAEDTMGKFTSKGGAGAFNLRSAIGMGPLI